MSESIKRKVAHCVGRRRYCGDVAPQHEEGGRGSDLADRIFLQAGSSSARALVQVQASDRGTSRLLPILPEDICGLAIWAGTRRVLIVGRSCSEDVY